MDTHTDLFRALSALNAWQDNYNHNDIRAIARSIRRFGMNGALRVWRGTVMAGNHTFKALQLIREEGPDATLDRSFPPEHIRVSGDDWLVLCIDVSHLTDEREVKAFAIADNQLARNAVADEDVLAKYLREVSDYDDAAIAATGFDDDQLQRLLARLADDLVESEDIGEQTDQLTELRQQWQTEVGQLWIIPSLNAGGDHRLLCGDSTNADHVKRLMAGERAKLFATDPPYLVDYDGTNHPSKWNESDAKKNKDWSTTYHDWDSAENGEALYDGYMREAVANAIVENAAWYCWHASRNQAMLEGIWDKHGAFVHQQIIWAKDRPILTRAYYMWQHEPCFFGWVRGKMPERYAEDYPSTVWNIPTIAPGQSTNHPTSKPIEVFSRPMEQHTLRGDLCYEPFSGSGSQLVAGEQTGRRVYGMEISPEYVAGILERASGLGLKPHLE